MKKAGMRIYGLTVALVFSVGAAPTEAQDVDQPEPVATAAQEAEPPEEVVELGELQVVGSRVAGRSAQDSLVPVDIIQGEDLQTYGIRDMDSLLAASIPSYNVGQVPIADAATVTRPANLRGLSPDSTLVLVNGKRRHRSSVVQFNGGNVLGRGSHAPDIGQIPTIALEQVEVLRDGAAAQYGSDAIAGILNFKLREDREGLEVQTSYGQNYHGDGDKVDIAANLGLPLTESGFANFSFQFTNADETSRSVQRSDARGLIEAGNTDVRRPAAQIWGAPEVQYDYKFFGNLGLDLEDIKARLYAFGNYAERKVEGGFFFRNPNTRGGIFNGGRDEAGNPLIKVADLSDDLRGCPNVPANAAADYSSVNLPAHCFMFNERFPGGFTPRFGGVVEDWSIVFGLRGHLEGTGYWLLDGWSYDASAGFGQNSVDFFMHNTINPQLAHMRTAIPTSYKPGGYREFDKTFNFDITRPFDTGLFYSELNFAFGLEYREEEFEVNSGGENSWKVNDNLARQGFGIGSNGFPGFRPDIAGTFRQDNYAGYLDVETEVIKTLTVGLAGRYEDYGAVGDTVNGKASARWQMLAAEMVRAALRGSVSSGFRAPTVGQSRTRNVSTAFGPNGLEDEATLEPTNPIAQIKGAKKLTPEKSVSYSIGTVFSLGKLDVTIDYFRIKVQDRIGLSSEFRLTADEKATLINLGVADASSYSSVKFFTNDFDTTTQGIDLVATYPLETVVGNTLFTFVGNWTDTMVDSRGPDVINDTDARLLEEALPEFRFSLSADHRYGPWRLLTRLHFYDEFFEKHVGSSSLPLTAGERFLMDLEASYTFLNLPFMEAATIAFGAQNLFDQYPRRNPYATIVGAKYPESSPYGFNGGFYYLRASLEF